MDRITPEDLIENWRADAKRLRDEVADMRTVPENVGPRQRFRGKAEGLEKAAKALEEWCRS